MNDALGHARKVSPRIDDEVVVRERADTRTPGALFVVAATADAVGRPSEAEPLLLSAQAAVARAGNSVALHYDLLEIRAQVAMAADDPVRAQRFLDEGVKLLEANGARAVGSPLAGRLASAVFETGNVHTAARRWDEAVASYRAFGCVSFAIACASSASRASPSAGERRSGRSSLIATLRSRSGSRAASTTPMPPAPSVRMTSNRPTLRGASSSSSPPRMGCVGAHAESFTVYTIAHRAPVRRRSSAVRWVASRAGERSGTP